MAPNPAPSPENHTQGKILWVSANHRSRVGDLLREMDSLSADVTSSGLECYRAIRDASYCAIVAEFPLPDCSPDELLEQVQQLEPSLPVLIHDAAGRISDVVRLTKAGAQHFFGADFDPGEFMRQIESARDPRGLSGPEPAWRKFLVGNSSAMDHVFRVVELVGRRRCTVLLSGETGTGKEIVARAIHASGGRARLPMVTVNCAALPENLQEAELFGHVKGAFTGAANHRVGRFEQADGSTIFLDEIGEMPLDLQAKLLRILQEREFQRIGSSETIRVDLRIIAASNADLSKRVEEGSFREDLFYRLNVVPIRIPPLRERVTDIPALVDHLVKKICRAEEIPMKRISQQTLWRLSEYNWPGNVRQLENALEMAVALSGDRSVLSPDDFPLQAVTSKGLQSVPAPGAPTIAVPDHGLDFAHIVGEFERSILMQALEKTSGNKKQAADMLGLKRTTLAAKLRTFEAA